MTQPRPGELHGRQLQLILRSNNRLWWSVSQFQKLGIYNLLTIKFFTNLVYRIRFFWFVYVLRRVKHYADEQNVMMAGYSRTRLFLNKPQARILKLIRPLSVIESLNVDSKILAIGCRFETDMLYLIGYGFQPQNVRGLDMVSYSPWIDLGNMHKMSYADDTWNAVVLGWTLSYTDNPKQAASEIVRVTKPGGIIAIGLSYYPPERLSQVIAQEQLMKGGLIQSVDGILEQFGDSVDQVYFRHDPANRQKQGACLTVFSIRK